MLEPSFQRLTWVLNTPTLLLQQRNKTISIKVVINTAYYYRYLKLTKIYVLLLW